MSRTITASDVRPLGDLPNLSILPGAIRLNRNHHNSVASWVATETLKSPPSRFNYGVPEHIVSKLNLNIDDNPIIADLISSLAASIGDDVRYLEIGTSIGKTAYLVMAYAHVRNIPLVCFCLDIEEINEVFLRMTEDLFQINSSKAIFPRSEFFQRLAYVFRSHHNCDTSLVKIGKTFYYACGDEYDLVTWDIVAGESPAKGFNIVYSDALHDPSALRFEYSQLKALNLLCKSTLYYVFDDLEYSPAQAEVSKGMWSSVLAIAEDLTESFHDVNIYGGLINGWIGQHEHPHAIAVIACSNR